MNLYFKQLRNTSTKITAFILIAILLAACNSLKRIPANKQLLVKNEIKINEKTEKDEMVVNQLYQKPNSSIFGYRLRLNLFNLAKQNADSLFQLKMKNNPKKYEALSKWISKKQVDRLGRSFWYFGIHELLKKTGEAPVVLDEKSARKSVLRLQSYYFEKGFFDVKAAYSIDTLSARKAKINYAVTTGAPYIIDSIKTTINTLVLDSLYQITKNASSIKIGKQYKRVDFESERNRVTTIFRNNGAYFFQQNYITYTIDTIGKNKKATVDLIIQNQSIKQNDSVKLEPFKLYKISQVKVFTDHSLNKNKIISADSASYNNFNLYGVSKLKYRPKAITDAIFINKGNYFSDNATTLTTRYLSNLRVFNYPSIQYTLDPNDSSEQSLIASIYLTPRKKFSFGYNLDFTHSNIQDFGIAGSTSLSIRNIFKGAETLEIAARGTIGSSKNLANPKDNFFNVSEYGLDMKLNFPRLFFPFPTEKIIPKNMIPSTVFSLGLAKQENIGLDKENFTSSMSYLWTPRKNVTSKFDLFNVQYVKNINTANYFNVYNSSYSVLNSIAQNPVYNVPTSYFNENNELIIESGTNGFISSVLGSNATLSPSASDFQTIKSIEERRTRLTENNLIFSSSYSYSKTTKSDLADTDFQTFRTKIESAGNFLSLLAQASKQLKNQSGNTTFFDLEYSQYIKTELEYIKHWDLTRKRVLAIRGFAGIAIPYGNSDNIPFSKSYFAGGSNDNRGWQSYGLGPGSSGALNDFNEANLKIALNAELRFNFFGSLNGAIFVDAGNIWNVLDNITDEKSVFKGLQSLKNTAVGSGFGFRYDFSFFVVRLDLGFKTFNPAELEGKKWFRDYNFANSVVNIGINYPF